MLLNHHLRPPDETVPVSALRTALEDVHPRRQVAYGYFYRAPSLRVDAGHFRPDRIVKGKLVPEAARFGQFDVEPPARRVRIYLQPLHLRPITDSIRILRRAFVILGPEVEAVEHDRRHGFADGLRRRRAQRQVVADARRRLLEQYRIEGDGGGVGARHRRMALVGTVQLDFGMVVAQHVPYTADRRHGGVVVLRHLQIAPVEQAVHPFVGTQRRVGGAVAGVAVLPSPRHVKDDAGIGRAVADEVAQLLGIREALALHIADGEGRQLALLLQDDVVPTSGLDERGGGAVRQVALERAAAGRALFVQERITATHGEGSERAGQVVGVDVAVADEQHLLGVLRPAGQHDGGEQKGKESFHCERFGDESCYKQVTFLLPPESLANYLYSKNDGCKDTTNFSLGVGRDYACR